MSCPALFNAWLHSGAEHLQLRASSSNPAIIPSRKAAYEKLVMQREAIVSLKQVIETGRTDMITDEIVMSAFALALHPPERRKGAAVRMRSAPLSNLQWLSRFTDIVISDEQVQGLRHLVNARGGFDKLEMPGLKQGLSTFNLLVASKSLTQPFWPLRSGLEAEAISKFLSSLQESPRENEYSFWSSLIFPESMAWEVQAVSLYTAMLHDYSKGLLPGLNTGYVLEIRNSIHYHVMSLPSILENPDILETSSLEYEACRLGLVVYSLLILFPVPLMTEPYPDLAQLLKNELVHVRVDPSPWMSNLDLLLWLLTMGGIAALGTDTRWWYIQQIQWVTAMLELHTWEHFKSTVASILWLDSPCDFEGLPLWEESCIIGA
ncbi:hypothetical protein N7452_010743 [Penicillium brevicompactum]|uniref:Uncharacterized protein n=1 Tax=Penicillium brevicompactum TaxID=5074 RepID=A0A9W9Q184_PENBR|nr:hypothetical protein N7452_010743 [Penicillium brevicompactum]